MYCCQFTKWRDSNGSPSRGTPLAFRSSRYYSRPANTKCRESAATEKKRTLLSRWKENEGASVTFSALSQEERNLEYLRRCNGTPPCRCASPLGFPQNPIEVLIVGHRLSGSWVFQRRSKPPQHVLHDEKVGNTWGALP